VKVGTSTLTAGTRAPDETFVQSLAGQIAAARAPGREVILVTSGAIAAGLGRLGLTQRPRDIGSLQAVAAVGQNLLMHTYEAAFRRVGITAAQVLITAGDLADRKRFVNFSNALASLFRYGVVPVVNENDTVAVEEVRLGDNDTLSAQVANAAGADLLLLLSDTDGVYTADPRRTADAQRIPVVAKITPDMHLLAERANGPAAGLGTGGLATKLRAAEICTSSGIPVVLARGSQTDVVADVLSGKETGTLFLPADLRINRRKRWIGYTLVPRGTVTVDAGARRAVMSGGKSLLPSGIVSVSGAFGFGDAVRCVDEDGVEFARGLVNYPHDEIERIRGQKTTAIEGLLGYRYADEVIHRDNLVLVGKETGARRVDEGAEP
jgi:glutamate 5-kinase